MTTVTGRLSRNSGHQLSRGHQKRAVSEKRHDAFASVWNRQPYAQSGRNLITHAGKAKLQMAVAAVGGVPNLLQVARRTAAAGNYRVSGLRLLLQQADDLALGEDRGRVGDDVGVGGDRRLVEGRVRIQSGRTFRLPLVIATLHRTLPACWTRNARFLDRASQRG